MSELARAKANQSIPLDGYELRVEHGEGGTLLCLDTAEGAEALRVTLSPDGPILHLGAGLRIAVAGKLEMEAERVELRGREGVVVSSGRDLELECTRDMALDAREHHLRARLGDVRVQANDDVKINGERIRLNC